MLFLIYTSSIKVNSLQPILKPIWQDYALYAYNLVWFSNIFRVKYMITFPYNMKYQFKTLLYKYHKYHTIILKLPDRHNLFVIYII